MVNFVAQMKGFTVIETIAAALIISITLGASLLVIESVSSGYATGGKSNYSLVLKGVCEEALKELDYRDGTFPIGGLEVNKKVSKYRNANDLWLMRLEAVDSDGRVIAVYNKVFEKLK